MLSATDPVAVTELSKRLPVHRRLLTLMEGESLLNDATTVVLFMLLISAATTHAPGIELSAAATDFLRLALSLPIELEGWWTVQSIAYGVVLFSLFVQAPLA